MLTTLDGYTVLESSAVSSDGYRLIRYFLAVNSDGIYRIMREEFNTQDYSSGELVLLDTEDLAAARIMFNRQL